ncbi:MAG: hypothetical protein ACR2RF_20470, partial [Geminicoccaceae bacterium]
MEAENTAEAGERLVFNNPEPIIDVVTGDNADFVSIARTPTASVQEATIKTNGGGDGVVVFARNNAEIAIDTGDGGDFVATRTGFDAEITIDTGKGADTVDVFGARTEVRVSGGPGNDDITVDDFFPARGDSSVDAGPGDDSVKFIAGTTT